MKKFSKDLDSIKQSVEYHLKYTMGKELSEITGRDIFMAFSHAVRDRIMDTMLETEERYFKEGSKRLYYLSIEFLLGRLLENNIYNMGLYDIFEKISKDMGINLEDLEEKENDPALGNGGLGRLAACFLDSLATLDLAGYGYGINYQFGLFKQRISNGYQIEVSDQWLWEESPWLIKRPEDSCIIPVYGRIVHDTDMDGNYNPLWLDWQDIVGVPYDIPVTGYGGKTVNYLRLFSARASDEFDMDIFNEGDYFKAVERKMLTETITKVLYPSDSFEEGRELRLIQEYFLVACAIRDIMRKFKKEHNDLNRFPEKIAIQLNDTHPSITVAELMRILVDENNLPWEKAWNITVETLGYTNHTLLPEALEKWSVPLFEKILPRHLQIIYEINRSFLREVIKIWPDNNHVISKMSLIEESNPKQIRMANLAITGSHSINGVSALHSELIKTSLVPEFYHMFPERFNNKTNGITQRRWLNQANPLLSELLTKTTGDGWIKDLDNIREVEKYKEDSSFQKEFMGVKKSNKERLAKIIKDTTGYKVDPSSLFDIQAKRIHEYKRQLLNVMNIIHEYLTIIEDGILPEIPKTYIFAGKAAPGYWVAKQIIKFINNLGMIINNDKKVKDLIKVIFIPDYRVSLAEKIIPAADLSEQISTAGMEASGTGNMKFAVNGALTIGTLDGANIEIMEEVGADNIYIFGLKAGEIDELKSNGSYNPLDYYYGNSHIKRIMDSFADNIFCPLEPELFKWVYYKLLKEGDGYFHLADLMSYKEAHKRADTDFNNKPLWASKAILNVARTGKFSSDRTILEYSRDIWRL
jgi:starch phosphorylase